jgi:hypothetical protein
MFKIRYWSLIMKKVNNILCDQAASDEHEVMELLYRLFLKDIYVYLGANVRTCLVNELDTPSSGKFWRAYGSTAAHKMRSLYMNVGFRIWRSEVPTAVLVQSAISWRGRGSAVGPGTVMQTGRSRAQFPMSLHFSLDLILQVLGWTQPLTEMSTRYLPEG